MGSERKSGFSGIEAHSVAKQVLVGPCIRRPVKSETRLQRSPIWPAQRFHQLEADCQRAGGYVPTARHFRIQNAITERSNRTLLCEGRHSAAIMASKMLGQQPQSRAHVWSVPRGKAECTDHRRTGLHTKKQTEGRIGASRSDCASGTAAGVRRQQAACRAARNRALAPVRLVSAAGGSSSGICSSARSCGVTISIRSQRSS